MQRPFLFYNLFIFIYSDLYLYFHWFVIVIYPRIGPSSWTIYTFAHSSFLRSPQRLKLTQPSAAFTEPNWNGEDWLYVPGYNKRFSIPWITPVRCFFIFIFHGDDRNPNGTWANKELFSNYIAIYCNNNCSKPFALNRCLIFNTFTKIKLDHWSLLSSAFILIHLIQILINIFYGFSGNIIYYVNKFFRLLFYLKLLLTSFSTLKVKPSLHIYF